MEEGSPPCQQDAILYPLVDSSLDKNGSIASSLVELSSQIEDLVATAPEITTSSQTTVISQTPQHQIVSTNVTTAGSNPLQVSVKASPNTVVNQALINNIINTDAVQTLLRDNPGQPITIVRMPESLQIPNLNFPLTPISNLNLNNLKPRKREPTTVSIATRGRKIQRKATRVENKEETSNFLQFQKSLQFKTRSGRMSKPPLYRVKETLNTPNIDTGEPSNKRKEDRSMEIENVNNQPVENKSPNETTGHVTTGNLGCQSITRRGHRGFRGYSRGRRRARGRLGNLGNRLNTSDKLKELLTKVPDTDLVSQVMPKLTELLTPWEFLLMRALRRRKTEPDKSPTSLILDELQDLLEHVQGLGTECLFPESQSPDQSKVDISGNLSKALGVKEGSYYIKELQTESLPVSVTQMMESTSKEEFLIEQNPGSEEKSNESISDGRPKAPPPSERKLNDIFGVETIFPDRALKSKTGLSTALSNSANTVIAEKPPHVLTDDSMVVNVEELESPVLDPGHLNLTHVAQPSDPSIPSKPDSDPLQGQGLALYQVPSNALSQTVTLGEPPAVITEEQPLLSTGSVLDVETVEPDTVEVQSIEPVELPAPRQTVASAIVPEGSTIMQMTDGNFLVQKPDGTAMQIQAPEGMTIETIQALLTVETEVFPDRPGVPEAINSGPMPH